MTRLLNTFAFIVAFATSAIILTPSSSFADEAGAIRACNDGRVAACEDLAGYYLNGPSENLPKMAVYAEKACNLNSARACNNLGVAWSLGKYGVSGIDLAKGNAYYRKACELNHALACFNFANMYRLGEGVAVDMKLAMENYTKACELNEAKGCTELGIMYHEGKVVEKNIIMTMYLFDKGCKLGSALSCKNRDILSPRVSQ